jgi:hypothetical protein
MKDFKKLPKMACGGKVKKMSEGGSSGKMGWDDVQKYVDEIPKRKAEAEQRMKDYKEGNAKSMAQFRENMSNIGKDYDKKIAEAKVKHPPTKSGGGGSMGGGDMSGMKGLDKPYKRGGKVKK